MITVIEEVIKEEIKKIKMKLKLLILKLCNR